MPAVIVLLWFVTVASVFVSVSDNPKLAHCCSHAPSSSAIIRTLVCSLTRTVRVRCAANAPTMVSTKAPTTAPTTVPTTQSPSATPTAPTSTPTGPSYSPTVAPTTAPSTAPTSHSPTTAPTTLSPTAQPTAPTPAPTAAPTWTRLSLGPGEQCSGRTLTHVRYSSLATAKAACRANAQCSGVYDGDCDSRGDFYQCTAPGSPQPAPLRCTPAVAYACKQNTTEFRAMNELGACGSFACREAATAKISITCLGCINQVSAHGSGHNINSCVYTKPTGSTSVAPTRAPTTKAPGLAAAQVLGQGFFTYEDNPGESIAGTSSPASAYRFFPASQNVCASGRSDVLCITHLAQSPARPALSAVLHAPTLSQARRTSR